MYIYVYVYIFRYIYTYIYIYIYIYIKLPNETQREALKFIVLNELIEIDAQQLECDAPVCCSVLQCVARD